MLYVLPAQQNVTGKLSTFRLSSAFEFSVRHGLHRLMPCLLEVARQSLRLLSIRVCGLIRDCNVRGTCNHRGQCHSLTLDEGMS